MAEESNRSIIVVRSKRRHHEAHHGGAWKVAYADFVTAMMAFFLLLWLLNVTTDTQKLGIAQYFAPENVSESTSGAGGVLSGTSVLSPGAMPHGAGGFMMGIPQTSGNPANEDDPDETFPPKPVPNPDPDATDPAAGNAPSPHSQAASGADATSTAELQAALAAKEDKEFARAEAALNQAIASVPELRPLRDNLIVDRTPEGLRIQIVDQDHQEMFPVGSPLPNPHLRDLVGLVAQVVKTLPNPIVLTGHTDSLPYPPGAVYTNWELSIDRANACRRALIAAGLPAARIKYVTGKADTDPLIKANPADPRNRRITFVLLRQAKPAAAAPSTAAATIAKTG